MNVFIEEVVCIRHPGQFEFCCFLLLFIYMWMRKDKPLCTNEHIICVTSLLNENVIRIKYCPFMSNVILCILRVNHKVHFNIYQLSILAGKSMPNLHHTCLHSSRFLRHSIFRARLILNVLFFILFYPVLQPASRPLDIALFYVPFHFIRQYLPVDDLRNLRNGSERI